MRYSFLIFIGIFLISLVTAFDEQTYYICGGDEQTMILCLGDEENSYYGFDTGNLQITVNLPLQDVQIGGEPAFFDISTNKKSFCVYSLNGHANQSLTTSDNYTHTNSETLPVGFYQLIYYCETSLGEIDTNSIDFSVFRTTTGGSTGGTDANPIPIANETNQTNQTYESNLTDLIIETEEICIGYNTKIFFRPLDSLGNFIKIDKASLSINNNLTNYKARLNEKGDKYYFEIESRLEEEIEVKILVEESEKQIFNIKKIEINQCKTIIDKAKFGLYNYIIYSSLILFIFLLFLIILLRRKKKVNFTPF